VIARGKKDHGGSSQWPFAADRFTGLLSISVTVYGDACDMSSPQSPPEPARLWLRYERQAASPPAVWRGDLPGIPYSGGRNPQ